MEHNYLQTLGIARDVFEVFKVFNDATYTFSLVYVPTSHIFCYTGLQVVVTLQSGIQIELIMYVIADMRLKWLAYYKVIPDTFLVATTRLFLM